MPVWVLAILIFLLRIVDVSLGTLRTISVVRGRVRASMMFGFAEVLVWSVAVTQVFVGKAPMPVLLGYAAGYAAGNAVGIVLEQRFARRRVIFTIFTQEPTQIVASCRGIDPSLRIREGTGVVHLVGCRTFAERIGDQVRRTDPEALCVVQDEL